MNTVNKDRESLKRLVESYGKNDVMKFVNSLKEEFNEDNDAQTYLIELGIYDSGGYKIYRKAYFLVKTVEYPVDENKCITEEALDSVCALNDITMSGYKKEEYLRADANTGFLVWNVVEEGQEAEEDYEKYIDIVSTVKYLRSKNITI